MLGGLCHCTPLPTVLTFLPHLALYLVGGDGQGMGTEGMDEDLEMCEQLSQLCTAPAGESMWTPWLGLTPSPVVSHTKKHAPSTQKSLLGHTKLGTSLVTAELNYCIHGAVTKDLQPSIIFSCLFGDNRDIYRLSIQHEFILLDAISHMALCNQ